MIDRTGNHRLFGSLSRPLVRAIYMLAINKAGELHLCASTWPPIGSLQRSSGLASVSKEAQEAGCDSELEAWLPNGYAHAAVMLKRGMVSKIARRKLYSMYSHNLPLLSKARQQRAAD